MKKRGIAALIIVTAVIIIAALFAVFGFKVSIYDVKPLYTLIQRSTEVEGGTSLVLHAVDTDESTVNEETLNSAIGKIMLRLENGGYDEAIVSKLGSSSILVELPNSYNISNLEEYLSSKAEFSLREADGTVIITNDDINSATYGYSTDENQAPTVTFELTEDGKQKFADITETLIGESIAMYVDNEFITAAQVGEKVESGIVSMTNFRDGITQAKNIAGYINSGSLPVELEVAEKRTTEASISSVAFKSLIWFMFAATLIVLAWFCYKYGWLLGILGWFVTIITMLAEMIVMITLRKLVFGLAGIMALSAVYMLSVYMISRVLSGFRNLLWENKKAKSAWKDSSNAAFTPLILSASAFVVLGVSMLFAADPKLTCFGYILLSGALTDTFVGLFAISMFINLAIKAFDNKNLYIPAKKNVKTLNVSFNIVGIATLAVCLVTLLSFVIFNINYGTEIAGGSSVTITVTDNSYDADDLIEACEYDKLSDYTVSVLEDNSEIDSLNELGKVFAITSSSEITAEDVTVIETYIKQIQKMDNVIVSSVNTIVVQNGLYTVNYSVIAALILAVISAAVVMILDTNTMKFRALKAVQIITLVCTVFGVFSILQIEITKNAVLAMPVAALIGFMIITAPVLNKKFSERAYTCAVNSAQVAIISVALPMLMTSATRAYALSVIIITVISLCFVMADKAIEKR